MKTTLNKIKSHAPCVDGWKKLLKYLKKTKEDDESLSIATILESNGLDDAIWCLRSVEGYDKEKILFSVFCARQVEHFIKDQQFINAIDVAEKYANGEATQEELRKADKVTIGVMDSDDVYTKGGVKAHYASCTAHCATSSDLVERAPYYTYVAYQYKRRSRERDEYFSYAISKGDIRFTHPPLDGIKKEQAEELKRLCALTEK